MISGFVDIQNNLVISFYLILLSLYNFWHTQRNRKIFQMCFSDFQQGKKKKALLKTTSLIYLRNLLKFTYLSRHMTKPTSDHVPREDSDQPGHPPSLIRVFAVRLKKAWVLSYPLSTQQRLWSDWVHSHFVGFVMLWLICLLQTVFCCTEPQMGYICFCSMPSFIADSVLLHRAPNGTNLFL